MVALKPLPSVVDFTKLLGTLVKIQQHSVALHLFVKMLERDAPVNIYTFNVAIDCLCRLNRVELSFAILGSLVKRGITPDVITFNTLIKGLFLDGNVSEAKKLFMKLLREKICELDEVTFLIVINGLCKAGRTLRARDLLLKLEKRRCKPNIKAYSTVIDCLCNSPNIVSYSIVIEGLCKNNKLDLAIHMFNELPSKGLQPNIVTFNILIGAHCKAGKMEEAKDLLMSMAKSGCLPDSMMYNIFVRGFLKRDKPHDAIPLLEEMNERGFALDVNTFTMFLDHVQEEGEDGILFNKIKKLVP